MSNNFLFVQAQNFSLAGAGAISGATSIVLKSLIGIDGALLTMSNFGTIGFGTIEPGNGTQEEQISWTGIVQNANGTATLTGVSSVLFVSPYTATSGLAKTHPGSSIFIISNTAGFYNELTSVNDDETINGDWTFANFSPSIPTATSSDTGRAASIGYVNAIAIAGAPLASATVIGISKLDTAPASPTTPIAIGVNSALLNTYSGTALNGTSNKIVDTGAVALTGASKILLLTAGGKITTSTIDTGTGANQIVQLNSSSQLPAVSGALLTNLPQGVASFVSPLTTVNNATSAGNVDTVFTTTFTPSVIKVHFNLNGVSSSTSNNLIGEATYNGSGVLQYSVIYFNGASSNLAGTTQIIPNNFLPVTTPIITTIGGSSTQYSIAISIVNISSTGFTVRVTTGNVIGSPSGLNQTFVAVATA